MVRPTLMQVPNSNSISARSADELNIRLSTVTEGVLPNLNSCVVWGSDGLT